MKIRAEEKTRREDDDDDGERARGSVRSRPRCRDHQMSRCSTQWSAGRCKLSRVDNEDEQCIVVDG